ncbi:MAG: sensor histidine kinase [Nocardioidaceae bacterium]
MDGSTATALLVLGGAVVGGFVVGSWRWTERSQRALPPQPEPLLPAGVDSVLTVLRSSAVVLGDDDAVLKASAPAHALGLLDGDRLTSGELIAMVAGVRRDGQIREGELTLPRRAAPALQVAARVAPLGSRLVLVLLEDRTRERRVESIRRDFAANVSHELKTPVGALNLLAEAVGEAADDPEAVHRFSARMLIESERLTRLVQQIIELSRLQGDDLVEHPVPIDVDDLVRTALDRSRTDAEAKQITLVAPPSTGAKVLGNPDQIAVAVANLVENAVAYSFDGSRVAVTVKTADDCVAITVSDQGIGIPEAELERIFERFYRVDPARARTTGGTGLGLSIVKHVAASHGGEISVWSVPDEGSSFTISLPTRLEPRR